MAAANNRIIPKEIRAVFFDLYGTLLDYGNMSQAWTDWFLSVYNSFQKYGLSKTKVEFAKICDGFFERPEPPIEKDELTVFERRIKRLAREVNLDLYISDIKKTVESAIEAWHQYITLDPDAYPILKKLKTNKILGLITNFDHPPHIYSYLAETELTDLFDVIVVSGEIGYKKPDKRIFQQALNQAELRPAQAAYIGDTADDIRGAKRAGLIPILIRRNDINNYNVAADFKSDNSSSITYEKGLSKSKNVTTIRRLPELLDIKL